MLRGRGVPAPVCRVSLPRKRVCLSRVRASIDPGWVETSAVVGKSILAFVGTYSALQWLYYRNIRKEVEKARDDRGDKDKKDLRN